MNIFSSLNIPIQQTLTNLSILSLDIKNRLTCQYEQLPLTVIDEISIAPSVRMFNVINHRLRAIKHIQNEFLDGLDVIMSSDFYQAPPIKDYWVFSSLNDIINALAPNFWKTMLNVLN